LGDETRPSPTPANPALLSLGICFHVALPPHTPSLGSDCLPSHADILLALRDHRVPPHSRKVRHGPARAMDQGGHKAGPRSGDPLAGGCLVEGRKCMEGLHHAQRGAMTHESSQACHPPSWGCSLPLPSGPIRRPVILPAGAARLVYGEARPLPGGQVAGRCLRLLGETLAPDGRRGKGV
jgi:hypothetical protein